MQNPADALQQWPVERLRPFPRNARTHSEAQIAQIAASIQEWGWTNPVLATPDGTIIAGHGRVRAAQALGMTTVPVTVADGWTEAQVRAYVLADNRLALESGWDETLLAAELADLSALKFDMGLMGFEPAELADLLRAPAGSDPDEVPAAPVVPVSRTGDLWLLGAHRLLCGDSTKAEDVARLMGGAKADMVFTDPPYGVGYVGGTTRRDAIQGDETPDLYGPALLLIAAHTIPKAAVYLWHSDSKSVAVSVAVSVAGFERRCTIIWNKNMAQFGALGAQYKTKHEPCYYLFKRGQSPNWYGPTNAVTVWDVARETANKEHPTQKPVELATRALENSSKADDVVLDLFGGSGSTCIAAEMTGRACYALEIAPQYADVSVLRWQLFTGKQATFDADGRTFEEVKRERTQAAADAPEAAVAVA